jgi:hypothetical protein
MPRVSDAVVFSSNTSKLKPLFKLHIWPVTYGDLVGWEISQDIVDGVIDDSNPRWEEYFETPIDYVSFEKLEEPTRTPSITVDLLGTDETIINDFKAYLKDAREVYECMEGALVKNKTIERLFNLQIIPFLDLTIWAKLENVEISNEVIGQWLYEDEFDISLSEKVRKVTRPFAKKVMNRNFIEALASKK